MREDVADNLGVIISPLMYWRNILRKTKNSCLELSECGNKEFRSPVLQQNNNLTGKNYIFYICLCNILLNYYTVYIKLGFPCDSVKNPPAKAGDICFRSIFCREFFLAHLSECLLCRILSPLLKFYLFF